MGKLISAALGASMIACLCAPLSPSFAQAGISTNPAPVEGRDYLAAVHALSRYEVASSRLAVARSKAGATRSFAQEMIDYHARVVEDHARLLNIPGAADSGSALVGPLSEMLDSLENISDGDFGAAYKRGQVAAHEEALKVHSAYAARGSDPVMRAKAQSTVSITQRHLDAARGLPGA